MDDFIRIYNQTNKGELRNKYPDDCISYEKGLYFLKDGLHIGEFEEGKVRQKLQLGRGIQPEIHEGMPVIS